MILIATFNFCNSSNVHNYSSYTWNYYMIRLATARNTLPDNYCIYIEIFSEIISHQEENVLSLIFIKMKTELTGEIAISANNRKKSYYFIHFLYSSH